MWMKAAVHLLSLLLIVGVVDDISACACTSGVPYAPADVNDEYLPPRREQCWVWSSAAHKPVLADAPGTVVAPLFAKLVRTTIPSPRRTARIGVGSLYLFMSMQC